MTIDLEIEVKRHPKVALTPFETASEIVANYLMHDKPGLTKPQALELAMSAVMYARLSV